MAKDEQAVWATDGEMFGVAVEVTDVDDTGDGYELEQLEPVDLVVGEEPEEGVEVEVVEGHEPDEVDRLRVDLANALFQRNGAEMIARAIAREAEKDANQHRIEITSLKAHCGRLEGRCLELTELLAIYEQEMRWPQPARPRTSLFWRAVDGLLWRVLKVPPPWP